MYGWLWELETYLQVNNSFGLFDFINFCLYGWLGESTLCWPPLGCHIVLIFWMVIFEPKPCQKLQKVFHNVFAYYSNTKPNNNNNNKLIIFSLYYSGLKYIFMTKILVTTYSKMQILQKWLKLFLTFMKFMVVIHMSFHII
jgi:hypothetical protein